MAQTDCNRVQVKRARVGVALIDPSSHSPQHHRQASWEAATVVLTQRELNRVHGSSDRRLGETCLTDLLELLKDQFLHLQVVMLCYTDEILVRSLRKLMLIVLNNIYWNKVSPKTVKFIIETKTMPVHRRRSVILI